VIDQRGAAGISSDLSKTFPTAQVIAFVEANLAIIARRSQYRPKRIPTHTPHRHV